MGVAAVLVTVTGILFKSVIDYKQIRGVISNSQYSVLSSLNETEFSAFSYKTEKEIFVDIVREAGGRNFRNLKIIKRGPNATYMERYSGCIFGFGSFRYRLVRGFGCG